MPDDKTEETRLCRDKIAEYLTHLGLGDIDPSEENIRCWSSLQAFVADRVTVKTVTKPLRKTRLKPYGFDQVHPVKMLIRHVLN